MDQRLITSLRTVVFAIAIVVIAGCTSMRSETAIARDYEAEGDYTMALLSFTSARVNNEMTDTAWEAELARIETEWAEADYENAKDEARDFVGQKMEEVGEADDLAGQAYWSSMSLLLPS